MANRIVTKALAGLQDLIFGKQTVTQSRTVNGIATDVNIEGIYSGNIPYNLAGSPFIKDKLDLRAEVVANIAALQALDTDTITELYIIVLGYTTALDGGGGLFWLDKSDTVSTEDLSFIFNPDNLANGRWKRVAALDQLSPDNGDNNIVLTASSKRNQLFLTNFSTNRTVTLPLAGLYKGKTFKITKANTSLYTLSLINISPTVTIPVGDAASVEVVWSGTAWVCTNYSTIISNSADLLLTYDPAGHFHAEQNTVPDLTVRIAAGKLMYGDTLVVQNTQTIATAAADLSNPRIDRIVIDEVTGAASFIIGTAAVSPLPPTIPTGKLSCCQIYVPVGNLVVVNSQITDERSMHKKQLYTFRGALAWLNGNQSIANMAAYTTVAFNSETGGYDTDAIHSGGTFTVPTGVTKIRLFAHLHWDPASSTGYRVAMFGKNGSVSEDQAFLPLVQVTANDSRRMDLKTPVIPVVAGDYFRVLVYQNSGGALNLLGTNSGYCYAGMEIVE